MASQASLRATAPGDLLEAWKSDAEALRRRGALEQASLLESCIDEYEAWLQEWEAGVEVEAAAVIEGCHAETIRRKVRRGELANIGTPGKILIPRGQLRTIAAGSGPTLVEEEEEEEDSEAQQEQRVAPTGRGVASLTSIARQASRGRAQKRGATPNRRSR